MLLLYKFCFVYPSSGKTNLVVLAIGLALGIEDTGPVLGLEVGLGVDIDLNLNVGTLLLDGEGGDTDGVEETAEELADAGGAPCADDLTGLQGELGAEDGVLDGVGIDLAEGKGLVDGGALVAEGVDGAGGVDGNADGKAAGDAGGGGAGGGELLHGDAGDVLELGGELAGLKSSVGPGVGLVPMRQSVVQTYKNKTRHVRKIATGNIKFFSCIANSIEGSYPSKTNASTYGLGSESSSAGDKGGGDGGLHFV